jgi:hypothetical protein
MSNWPGAQSRRNTNVLEQDMRLVFHQRSMLPNIFWNVPHIFFGSAPKYIESRNGFQDALGAQTSLLMLIGLLTHIQAQQPPPP